jgi:hypothetical protein
MRAAAAALDGQRDDSGDVRKWRQGARVAEVVAICLVADDEPLTDASTAT